MVDIIRCKEQLANLYTQQPTLENYLSKLTRQARGEQKADCLQAFGTIQDVQHFLLHPEDMQLSAENVQKQPIDEQPIADASLPVTTPPTDEQKQPENELPEKSATDEHTVAPSDASQQTGFMANVESSRDAMIVTPFGEYLVMAGYMVV